MFVQQKTTRNICHHLVPPSYHFCFVRFVYHISIIHFYVIILHPIHPSGICKVMSLYTITISTLNEIKPAMFGSKVRTIKMFDKFTVTSCKKFPSLRFFFAECLKKVHHLQRCQWYQQIEKCSLDHGLSDIIHNFVKKDNLLKLTFCRRYTTKFVRPFTTTKVT